MKKYTIDGAMKRLHEISDLLESGECDLEKSMKLYQEGVELIGFCNKVLLDAKQKIVSLDAEKGGVASDE